MTGNSVDRIVTVSTATGEAFKIRKRMRWGHMDDELRGAALAAIEAWEGWNSGEPEPTVEVYDITGEVRAVKISDILRLAWTCTDIVPSIYFSSVADILATVGCPRPVGRRTYAACAHAITADIKAQLRRDSNRTEVLPARIRAHCSTEVK